MISPINGYDFKNWGETLKFKPKHYFKPSSEEEIQQIVQFAKQNHLKIRVVGSGHSWTHLCEAENQILITLENFQGLISLDREKKQATVKAGTKLFALSEILEKNGLAMINMGDINKQAIAGALSTGTHGTGVHYGIIPTQVVALSFINANGEKIECSTEHNTHIFKAAQVSLGSLGIITSLTLQCVDLYNLHIQKKKEKLSQLIPKVNKINQENRNFEFYWFPYTDIVQSKYSNETQEKPNTSGFKKWFFDIFLENNLFKVISDISKTVPASAATMSKICGMAISDSSEINVSHKIYATERLVKFTEMEYGVPSEKGIECLLKIKDFIEKEKINVHFPLEYRWVKGDDIYLSPAYGYETVFISCHMYLGMPYEKYFRGAEEIFLSYGGRPHWGKMHTQKADYLKTKYPKWEDFLQVRQEMDPEGLFLNHHLKEIFGIEN